MNHPKEIALPAARTLPRRISAAGGAALIPTKSLRSGAFSVRSSLQVNEKSIEELAGSIAASGIIGPIVVRQTEVGEFEVVAGERRLLAARLLNLQEVPCVVRECSTSEALLISLTENLQRSDLSPIEKAAGLKRLLVELELTQEEIGKRIGMPQSAVAHYLRLLTLPADVQRLLHEDVLSLGHGKVLAGIKDPERAIGLASLCVTRNLSVRELEVSLSNSDLGRRTSCESPRKKREERELPNGVFLVIKENLGETCSGTIEIPYYSATEKDWVLDALCKRTTKRGTSQGEAGRSAPRYGPEPAPRARPI